MDTITLDHRTTTPASTLPLAGLSRLDAAMTALITGFLDGVKPLIEFACEQSFINMASRSCIALNADDVGKTAVVLFEGGDVRMPIVVGILQESAPPADRTATPASGFAPDTAPGRAEAADEVEIHAPKKLTLTCGKSSMTLRHDGRVELRGVYLISRAEGVNRILGGTVELN